MRIDIVTLFPELCDGFLSASILGRARAKNLFEAHCHQIRDYTKNKQKQTDDYPYGGGCGMVLYAQPIADCLRAVQDQCAAQGRTKPHVVFLTAAGQQYNEETAKRLASYDSLALVCGHYEGIDQRVIDAFGDEEISIGDYVLTGGELASLVVADRRPAPAARRIGRGKRLPGRKLLGRPAGISPSSPRPKCGRGRRAARAADRRPQEDRRLARRPEPSAHPERRLTCTTGGARPTPSPNHPRREARWENVRLVKTEEQMARATELMAEGRPYCLCPCLHRGTAGCHDAGALAPRPGRRAKNGWAFYLHYNKVGETDAMVGVCHKTGMIGHLFVTESARGQGIGAKVLDFARKKLQEHEHPTLSVLSTNTAPSACTSAWAGG